MLDLSPLSAAPRFFLDTALSAHSSIALPNAVLRHIQVLRLGNDAPIVLFNGQGGEYPATLHWQSKSQAEARTAAWRAHERELPFHLHLAQAVVSAEKMDWIWEKAVELGAASLTPLQTRRAVVKLSPERMEKRHGHWQRLVSAACEQCGRNTLPVLAPVTSLASWLQTTPIAGRGLIATPHATLPLVTWAKQHPPSPTMPTLLLIGPEGGFDEAEEQAAIQAGWTPVQLGTRVLRTETAGIAGLAMLQALWQE